MNQVSSTLNSNNTSRSAIFFSPHPDDETLGCGGTIIKKKRAGFKIKVLFMTDGRKSHPHLISEDELKRIRAKEALEVGRILGLREEDILFLEYRDGELNTNQNSAIHKVSKILELEKPGEIFIPSRKEPSLWAKDHVATNRIVMSALQMYNKNIIVNEYPIWLWYNQPRIERPSINIKATMAGLMQVFISYLILLKEFQYSVYVGDVLEIKGAALNQYRSQMTRLIPDSRWCTLRDLSNGKFLKCFFQEYEIFHRCTLNF